MFSLMNIWNKIPAVVRGLIIGMLIQSIGIMPLFFLIQKNIEHTPTFPWSLIAGGLILFLTWNFLTGKKLFFSPSHERADLSGANKLGSKSAGLMMVSGLFLAITLLAFAFLGYMLTEVPLQQIELLTALKKIPLGSSLCLLFIASLASGVIEELAWRGYAQRIIGKGHSAIVAIGVVALAFTIIHFLPFPVWPLFFIGSLGWGFLAYYSNSILPGIIFHTLIDLAAFIWAMFNLETFTYVLNYNVFKDGINSPFLILLIIAFASGCLTIVSLIRLKQYKANSK